MKVCFIGHRKIERTKEFEYLLKITVENLIKKGAKTFLFGNMSGFDELSWEVVTEIKKNYPCIKRVYVRSAYKDISKSYEKHLLKSFEETYFPPKVENAGKYCYVERNYEMIDTSTYCVFYYNSNYIVPLKRQNKKAFLSGNSGTKIAYEYAVKKRKEIINLYKD